MESLQKHGLLLLLSMLFLPVVSAPVNQPTEQSYMPEPKTRGTAGLLWSCISTFALCIWTAIHPDVVPIGGVCSRVVYKLVFMLATALLPELVLCYAWDQRRRAKQILKAWKDAWGNSEKADWLGMSGAFFVVMGGFVVMEDDNGSDSADDQPDMTETMQGRWLSLRTCLSRRLRSTADRLDGVPMLPPDKRDRFITTVYPDGFERLLDEGIIQNLVEVGTLKKEHFSRHMIEDKGKASQIAKTVVTIQLLWMVVQCFGRLANRLPVTLLEAHVLFQVSYSVLVYICWWDKPLDVEQPIHLPLSSETLSILGHDITKESDEKYLNQEFVTEITSRKGPVNMFCRASYDFGVVVQKKEQLWAAVFGLVNGILHSLVWRSHFPTTVERVLWHISSVGIGLCPPLTYLMVRNRDQEDVLIKELYALRFEKCIPVMDLWKQAAEKYVSAGASSKDKKQLPLWLGYLLVYMVVKVSTIYKLCIGYITVEAFISVRSLPAGAYKTVQWADVFPHF